MPQTKLRLAWDINSFSTRINGIDIVIASKTVAPFDIEAVVEEQDAALILSKPDIIYDPGDKPAWFLANKLESQSLLKPGAVIKRGVKPFQLLAIVHDLDQEPSWSSVWIAQSLENILKLSEELDLSAIQLPVLGAVHGRFEIAEFIQLLISAVSKNKCALKKIWLVVPRHECYRALSILKESQQQLTSKGR